MRVVDAQTEPHGLVDELVQGLAAVASVTPAPSPTPALPPPAPEPPLADEAPPAFPHEAQMRVSVDLPDGSRRALTIGNAYAVGRQVGTDDLLVEHPYVSRRHVELRTHASGVVARDLGSRHGASVIRADRRLPLDGGDLVLEDGDRIVTVDDTPLLTIRIETRTHA